MTVELVSFKHETTLVFNVGGDQNLVTFLLFVSSFLDFSKTNKESLKVATANMDDHIECVCVLYCNLLVCKNL